MGTVLIVFGVMIFLFGEAMFLIVAFTESFPWGIGCILFAPVSIIFLIMYWQEAKKSFTIELVGLLLWFLGRALNGEWS